MVALVWSINGLRRRATRTPGRWKSHVNLKVLDGVKFCSYSDLVTAAWSGFGVEFSARGT